MKKIFITIALIIFSLSHVIADSSFNDIQNEHENLDAIEYLKQNNIAGGYSDGTFKPENLINRAEFIKIVIGAYFNEEEINNCVSNNTQPHWAYVFSPDVLKNEWYAKYICMAKVNNIAVGYPDGTFKPEKNITSAEAIKIIVKAEGIASEIPYEPDESESMYWFTPYFNMIDDSNVIPDSISRFDEEISRGEMAEIIYRKQNDLFLTNYHNYGDLMYNTFHDLFPGNELYEELETCMENPPKGNKRVCYDGFIRSITVIENDNQLDYLLNICKYNFVNANENATYVAYIAFIKGDDFLCNLAEDSVDCEGYLLGYKAPEITAEILTEFPNLFSGDTAYEEDFPNCLNNPPYGHAGSCYKALISSVEEINTDEESGFLIGLCATKYHQPFETFPCYASIALRERKSSACELADSEFDCHRLYYDPEGYVRRDDLENYTLEHLNALMGICEEKTGAIGAECESMISQGGALLEEKGVSVGE